MKKLTVCLLAWMVLLSTWFAPLAQSAQVSAEQDYKMARTMASANKWQEAIVACERALKADPYYPDALYLAGCCYAQVNKLDKAVVCLKRLTEKAAPQFIGGWRMLVQIYVMQEEYDKAKKAIADLSMVKGGKADSYYLAGVLAWQQGDMAEAEKQWKLTVGAKPDMAAAKHNLGVLYKTKGDRARALSYFQEALRANPENPLYMLNMGIMELETGRKIDGMARLDKVRSQTERSDLSMLALAVQMFYNKQYGQAEKAATRALENNAELTDAYLYRAKALEALKRGDEARTFYERALKDNPNCCEAQEAVKRYKAQDEAKAKAEAAAKAKAEAEAKAKAEAAQKQAESQPQPQQSEGQQDSPADKQE